MTMTRTSEPTINQLVDTDRYPLTQPSSDRWHAAVVRARSELAATGCSVLADFVAEPLLATLRDECAEIAPKAYYGAQTVNVYNTDPDPTLPLDHPARRTVERGNAFVAGDRIPAKFLVQRLYTDDLFQRFLAACFGLARLHELADPLAGLCLNVVTPGQEHPWHFDTNEFTVSLLTQHADAGGTFEYCPGIRSADAENIADVSAVLAGRGGRLIHRLSVRPGDLQLFRGRYSLHRVTRVAGSTSRHSAIFAYSEIPGVVGSAARTRQLFGRVAAEHRVADTAVRVDPLLA